MNTGLYQEELLEHYKYPKHRKKINNPTFTAGDYNPSCGDKISMEGIVENRILTAIGFSGSGCVISQAAASMLTEDCIGKTVDDILTLNSSYIESLIKIPLGPTRLKCALLCLQVLQQGVAQERSS